MSNAPLSFVPYKALRWLLLCVAACGLPPAYAASLAPELLPRVQSATFEVVVPKPTADPLSYEKPLPLDLLPFQERNDKYFSIGTAFALGNNRYVTAAHVLDAALGGLYDAPALRDAAGHVYAIDQITKFSLGQDFAMFSLAQPPAQAGALEVDTRPALNQTVFAVGNALGTGVVVRDGLYTSNTPEEENGRWQWMRFSAAASPGNSGGPLLDQHGKVIGIVLMKSPNENLNYALPIGEVLKAPDHLAQIDKRFSYQANFLDAVQVGNFKQQFALPKSFADFSTTFQKLYDGFYDELLRGLLDKHADELFPHGAGSQRLLHASADMRGFPAWLRRDSAGNWALWSPAHDRKSLGDNGYVESGKAGNDVLLLHLRKPDTIQAAALYGDPKQYMDLLLKGWAFNRSVGTDKVRITSFGKPTRDSLYTDAYGRRWQVRVWPVAYSNVLVLSYSLPVPNGYVGMLELAHANSAHAALDEMQAQCDFVDVAYSGTLAQWKDYLAQTTLLPGNLAGIKLDIDYGHRFSYRSNRLELAYGPELLKIAPNSLLELGFSFVDAHGGKAGLEVGDIGVRAQADEPERINLSRHVAPAEHGGDRGDDWWNKLKQRQHPDDAVAYASKGETRIGSLWGHPADNAQLLYRATYSADGNVPQDAMKAKLDLLLKSVQVNEH